MEWPKLTTVPKKSSAKQCRKIRCHQSFHSASLSLLRSNLNFAGVRGWCGEKVTVTNTLRCGVCRPHGVNQRGGKGREGLEL